VVLKMNEHNRQSIDAIGELRLAVPGTQVGNGPARWRCAVADIELRQGVSRILRETVRAA
jgi:cobalt-zinc-cadmium resistance protein CzcA